MAATINPDITPYTNLTIYDKNPQDLVDASIILLQSRFPEWTPSETNLELALLEAVALEVSETIYTINRLPNVMLEVLLTLYGITRDQGAAPITTFLFTMSDNAGYVIPAGTEIAVPINSTDYLSFFTDVELIIVGGTTTGTVAATAVENVISANGIVSTTLAQLVNSITNVQSIAVASTVVGGIEPEITISWLSRGVQKLQRLSSTLVLPQHFTDAALEQVYVNRANTIDNFDISLGTGAPGDHPGHVSVVVYGFGANIAAGDKTALLTLLESESVSNLGVHITDPTIITVPVTVTVKKISSFLDADVTANVTAALTAYLNPNTWNWSGTVRVNELITLISNVVGVDYVVTLAAPAADVAIGVDTVLVNVGTITITVT